MSNRHRLLANLSLALFLLVATQPAFSQSGQSVQDKQDTQLDSQQESSADDIAFGSPIDIHGVDGDIKTNIELHLDIQQGLIPFSALGLPRSNNFVLKKVRIALQALGYYSPQLELTGDHNQWQLHVNAGKPVLWQSVSIKIVGEGAEFIEFEELIGRHPFELNSQMDHSQYSQFKNRLLTLANEIGFLEATFKMSEMLVNVEQSTATLVWLLDTQTQFHLRQIKVEGSRLADSFLQRYITLKPGQAYSQPSIIQTQQALNRSGYFRAITVEQNLDPQNYLADININLIDIEKYEFKTSLGYGTDSGPKIGASWQDRRVNDRGHQYKISSDLSEIEKSTAFQYKLPIDGNKNELIYRVSYRIKNEVLAESKLSTVESQMLLFHDDYWSTQSGLTLAEEIVTSEAAIETHLNYLVPSWQINYYSVKDPFIAHDGWRWQNVFRLSHRSFSDPDIEFIQWEQKTKYILKLNPQWRILARLQVGYTEMDDDQFNTNMPSSYRYFAGGDVSVRGYEYQTLSPSDSNGIFLGGKHLLTSSVELDWQFNDDFRWAIFSDRGNAFNDWDDIQLRSSIGTGLRWVTPVGSIRLDYARALDETKDWRWHISIGPDL